MARLAWIAAGACAGLLALVFLITRRDESPRLVTAQPEVVHAPTPLEILTSADAPPGEVARIPVTKKPFESGAARDEIDPDIVVRVVDAERNPVEGVRVNVGYGERGERSRVSSSGSTDRAGLCRFANLRKVHERAADLTDGVIAIFVRHAFLPPLRKNFTLETLPNRPIGFRLPPAGKVDVHVRNARGEPVSGGTTVRLGMIDPDETLRPALAMERRSHLKSTRDGVASFLVPAGHEFEVVAQHAASFAELEASVKGPSAPGEVVSVDLDFGRDHPIVKLHALDEAGEPMAYSRISANSSGGTYSRSLRTSKDGSFLLFLGSAAREGIELSFSTRNNLTARRTFGPLPAGRIEGGEVVFRPVEILASGRVVGAQGEPAGGSRVTWKTLEGEVRGSCVTGDEGAFEIRDEGVSGPFELVAVGNGGMSASVEVARGASGVVLALDGVGSLIGQLELGGINGVRGLVLHLTREDGSGKAVRDELDGPHFSFQALREGTYVLSVSSFEETIAEVGGLMIRHGEESRDPRLNPLDLSGRLELHRIEYGRHEKPINGEIRYRPAGDTDSAWQTVSMGRRQTWLAATAPAVDVEVLPTHYLSQRLENVQGHAKITFARKRRVRLRVGSQAALPALPLLLEVHLSQGGSLVGSPRGVSITGTSPEALMSANRTGRCEVGWTLHRVFAGEHDVAEVDLGPPVFIDVRDVTEEQVFDVEIPAEALQRLLANPPF